MSSSSSSATWCAWAGITSTKATAATSSTWNARRGPIAKFPTTEPYEIGYAPLAWRAASRKRGRRWTSCEELLAKRNIPISVVVYPWPAQIAHDTVDSRQCASGASGAKASASASSRCSRVLRPSRDECPPSTSRLLVPEPLHLRRYPLQLRRRWSQGLVPLYGGHLAKNADRSLSAGNLRDHGVHMHRHMGMFC